MDIQSFNARNADQEPELQRPELSGQLWTEITEVDLGVRSIDIEQVLGTLVKRVPQTAHISDKQAAALDWLKEPFVSIKRD